MNPATQNVFDTTGLTLLFGPLFLFGSVAVLIAGLGRDTAQHPQEHQHNTHLDPPVVFTRYRNQIHAMQNRALELLEEEPLRGYTNLGIAAFRWFAPTPEGDNGPIRGYRLGPQDPTVAVPHRNQF